MDETIYEVTLEDYKGFIRQIKPGCFRIEKNEEDEDPFEHIISVSTNRILAARRTNKNITKYYIYEFPAPEERRPAKPIFHLNLETREEVQAFFNVLNKMYKEGENHGRTLQ